MKTITGSAAILITNNNELVLQLRDSNPLIDNPKKIGLFGGAIEVNESFEDCIKRELIEELELDISKHTHQHFRTLKFTTEHKGIPCKKHIAIYVVTNVVPELLTLHEGQEIITLSFSDDFSNPAISPTARQVLEKYRNSTMME
jgi:8-oxo-dGTP pyrophosphatase MutT (NUDIX family)